MHHLCLLYVLLCIYVYLFHPHTVMAMHTLFVHALLVDCPIGGCTWLYVPQA